jgi:hypothetical protein
MTTEIERAYTLDIFSHNEILNFDRSNLFEKYQVGAISWAGTGKDEGELFLNVIKIIRECVSKKMSGYCMRIFVGNSAWQQNSRVVRYHKLWGALKVQGVNLPDLKDATEVLCEFNRKVKFFGQVELAAISPESIIKILFLERATYLAALPETVTANEILLNGWSGNIYDDLNVLRYFVENKGILFSRIGHFDDPKKGIVGIADRSVIKNLIEK